MSSSFFRHVLKAARIVAKVACLKLKKKKKVCYNSGWKNHLKKKAQGNWTTREQREKRVRKEEIKFVLKFSLSVPDP